MQSRRNSRGSIWRRWDPHIHTPGTVLNDQFGGPSGWESFLERVEASDPSVEALGITDYCSVENYEKVREYKRNGRIPNVKLIFPNVELRYAIGTPRGSPINFHLLVSPDDPKHVEEIIRFLQKLTFKAGDDEFSCSRDELIRLGRSHSGKDLDEKAALRAGVNQFKVSPDQFLTKWSDSNWIQKNALIALSSKSRDGSAGLQHDSSLASLRQKLERSAHIIFSPNPSDRTFWLGKGQASLEELEQKYRGRKPCLHGSDAHDAAGVAAPTGDRYTWIKGDACFESLRQACLEPELRVIVAKAPPSGALASRTMEGVEIANADWLIGGQISLNSGLVGIIGARGSGKTALVEMIAAGAGALHSHLSGTSFVKRAREPVNLLGNVTAKVHWKDGGETIAAIDDLVEGVDFPEPRVQYLSQQFVDQLCSAEGATDALVREIERVIFSAHRAENRMGAGNFRELLEIKSSSSRAKRTSNERSLAMVRERLAIARNKIDAVPAAEQLSKRLKEQVKRDKAECGKLVTKEKKRYAEAFERVSEAANALRLRIQKAERRLQALGDLTNEVRVFREELRESDFLNLRERHAETGLSGEEWTAFRMNYVGDVDRVLRDATKSTKRLIKGMKGSPRRSTEGLTDALDSEAMGKTLIPKDSVLNELPLWLLEREEARLRKLIGATKQKEQAHKKLTTRITETQSKIEQQKKIIKDGQDARRNTGQLLAQRTRHYKAVFEGIEEEERVLEELYGPLSERLSQASGALGKLSFSIGRNVDLDAWVERGERLLDLRKAGEFRGRGALEAAAKSLLLDAWRAGSADQVATAMSEFRNDYDESLRAGAPVERQNNTAYLTWADQISTWLYSTDHVRVSYGIQHEGVDIGTLSPGTRGIVLLLLYLAIDHEDDRPLIIDQPEENLDPKSIYEELVGLFRNAKLRRQIIVVTHNANLIVNTDADQVIVANCGQLRPGKLPDLEYVSGPLEDANIRSQVCSILEGGEQAFRERAKRLRIYA